jgi:hypothetical protein
MTTGPPTAKATRPRPALLVSGAFVPVLAMAACGRSDRRAQPGEERGVKAMDRDEACAAIVFQLACDPHLR